MSLMTIKDLDDKLLNVFEDCPYKGKRKDYTFPEMRKMEIDDRADFLDKMDEDEKVSRWQKHLECLMNALAK
jgi:L-rhamnose mutarotase